jgi:hypothetical protein
MGEGKADRLSANMGGVRSKRPEVADGLHEGQSEEVDLACFFDAVLLESADGSVGSSSRKADAESPAALVVCGCSTLVRTFLELRFASTSLQALGVLVRAFFCDALFEHCDFFRGRGIGLKCKGEGHQEEKDQNSFHVNKLIINPSSNQ